MAALVQTIAVVDKSGKAVTTSKHLINVFKEAKAAYRERKAEVVASRRYRTEEKRPRPASRAYTIDDDLSSRTSRDYSRTKRSHRRPTTARYHSDSVVASEMQSRPSPPPSPLYPGETYSSVLPPPTAIARRHTDHYDAPKPPSISRTMSSPCNIDMNLAYGEIPPPLDVAHVHDEVELKGLVNKVKMLLEEAECLQYSATAIIASLQKNPDAMAAVALTLAEISNIASKLAPGALTTLRSSSPAVFSLLASPQFMIAAGVGVGVTIVALGGYKIIKRIKAKQAEDTPGVDELLEIGGDASRIDNWRHGIAEVQAESVGTSVDGEFITPQAAALSRLNLNEDIEVKTHHRSSRRTSGDKGSSKSGSSSKEGRPKHSKSPRVKGERKGEWKGEKKEKKPSPLRLMFQ
ncbi:MAG: hypothetical protein Q9222_006711 [Ikaeria aurantiellina]